MPNIRYNQFHPLLLDYISRALPLIEPDSQKSRNVVWFLAKQQKLLGLSFPQKFPVSEPTKKKKANAGEEDVLPSFDEQWSSDIRIKRFEKAVSVVKQSQSYVEKEGVSKLRFFDNLNFFADKAKLDDEDKKLLTFYAATKRLEFKDMSYDPQGSFARDILGAICDDTDEDDYFRAIEILLGVPAETAKKKIYDLSRYGLLNVQGIGNFLKYRDSMPFDAFTINDHLFDILLSHEKQATLLDALIGEKAEGHLTVDDFAYMADHAKHLIESVKGAAYSDDKGKNYGVYGVPGVGKTQFMAVLSKEAGLPVYFVGASAKPTANDPFSAQFKEPKRSESFGDLLRASFIAKRLGLRVILAKDEAEGILTINNKDNNKEDTANKGAINFFLDHNETPTIFITNDLDALELAIQRRLVSWTAFRQPPLMARASILDKQLQEKGLKVDGELVRHLVEAFPDLTPGVSNMTLRDSN